MSHEEKDYIQLLRSHGYRVTPQRLIVLDAVCEVGGHATLGAVIARVKMLDSTIDLSTIYRALDVWVEVGLVVVSDMGEQGKVYKIAGDSAHHHLICQSCGKVLTIRDDEFNPLLDHLQAKYGFILRADHLSLPGLCHDCAG
jgi:Fur family transcriptional regulator, ferric uptake regulator